MVHPRRTEHCWPVAHTLGDLLPLIPDPSSFEAGSALRIERIMLPDVHAQLIQEIARRFCPAAGWYPVFLTGYATRAEQIDLGMSEGTVVSTHGNLHVTNRLLEEIKEESLKPLVMTEIRNRHLKAFDTLFIPRPVTSIGTKTCPHCKREAFIRWEVSVVTHRWCCRCPESKAACSRLRLTASVSGKPKPQQQSPLRKHKPWTLEESERAAQMHADGMTYRAIGEVLGRSKVSVSLHLRSGGYEGRQQRKALADAFSDDF